MTKVDINGANHQVTIEVDHADLGYVIEKAQKLYDETKPPERGLGPAYGFSMERQPRPSWDPARLGTERLPVRVEYGLDSVPGVPAPAASTQTNTNAAPPDYED